MSKRAVWLPVIAVIGLSGAAWWAPAMARGGAEPAVGGGVRSAPVAHVLSRAGRGPRIIVRRRWPVGYGSPLTAFPYQPYLDAGLLGYPDAYGQPPGTEDPASPNVIIIADSPALAGPKPPGQPLAMSSDDGFIAGCHPIPNGYHCDPATTSAPPQN